MPKSCFIPGCDTVFKNRYDRKPVEKSLTLFSVPKDPDLRKQWHIASRRADREMTVKDVVCELHFTEDCLLRHFTTKLFDGSTFKLERARPALKKGSIPTIFPFSNESHSGPKLIKRKMLCAVQDKDGKRKQCKSVNSSKRDLTPPKLYQTKASSAYVSTAVICISTNSSNKKIPGISCDRKYQSILKPPKNLQTDLYVSLDSSRSENFSTDSAVEDFDEMEVSLIETDSFVQEAKDEISEQISSNENMASISENLIAKGHEETFGKFVASELRILSCDPPLYLRTKEKIWQILEETSQKRKMGVT